MRTGGDDEDQAVNASSRYTIQEYESRAELEVRNGIQESGTFHTYGKFAYLNWGRG